MSDDTFPTTAWSFIQAAQDERHPEHIDALNRLISRYWRPVFYFLRSRGHRLHEAEDYTQEFFTRLLERDWLQRADPQRGRFRTFLLTVLVRFLSDEGDARAPRQKAFERRLVSIASLLTEQDRSYEPPVHETPETVFMQAWASSLLAEVHRQLREVCDGRSRSVWYELFEAAHAEDSTTQRILAERVGMTRDQVRYALARVEMWFGVLLRAEVRDQVGNDADIGDEIRGLMALLAH